MKKKKLRLLRQVARLQEVVPQVKQQIMKQVLFPVDEVLSSIPDIRDRVEIVLDNLSCY